MSERHLEVYTDGACSGNPGPGGWGFFCPELDLRVSGGKVETTNNQMELQAVIEALRTLLGFKDLPEVRVVTDSQYVYKGLLEWLPNWKKNNWVGAGKKPVKNKELWLELDRLVNEYKSSGRQLAIKWVRGHNGHPGNEEADKLAVAGIPGSYS